MEVSVDPREMQRLAESLRTEGRLALVPTMGALHKGHLALMREAAARADHLVVSIFVNPTQFGPGEDFESYPRPFEHDREILEGMGNVDLLFAPSEESMVLAENHTRIRVKGLDEHLCGPHRPGHFEGVATIVAKLFHICRPHLAVFGQKDAQQLVILRQMVKDLFFDIEIIGAPIVREADGLALSSRNACLDEEQRGRAPVLYKAVSAAHEAILQGEQQGEAVVDTMTKIIAQAPDARLQYAEVVDAERLQPISRIMPGQAVLAAVAVFFGRTRLIDNSLTNVPQRFSS